MCTGSQSLPPRPHITGQEREAGDKPKAQDKQSNGKDQGHKDRMDEAGFPGKNPCRGSLSGPGKTLAKVALPHQLSELPLSPRAPTPSTTLEPRLGRHLRGGMQIFVKTRSLPDYMKSEDDDPSPLSK